MTLLADLAIQRHGGLYVSREWAKGGQWIAGAQVLRQDDVEEWVEALAGTSPPAARLEPSGCAAERKQLCNQAHPGHASILGLTNASGPFGGLEGLSRTRRAVYERWKQLYFLTLRHEKRIVNPAVRTPISGLPAAGPPRCTVLQS
jgi:hypothetical protein